MSDEGTSETAGGEPPSTGDRVPADDDRVPADDDRVPAGEDHVRTDDRGRREVIVPLRLYKTVTVFSTLLAVIAVVLGFLLLDAATLQVGVFRRLAAGLFGVFGVDVAAGTLDALLAGAGLAVMALGAAVYVLGTRFRAPDMGKSQEDSPEGTDNG
ncbi:hypothetical protein AArcSl_0311 [Halalkaliarchaeum desulfuricum]|uniref:DUF7315 domain-containing protein n=1 Tax=Halalkaliarchaeum desulfuricum TaxID=2055893 RepID=A0A343TFU4_9EURY|nr:hypothetical protein [Halalkaliarchaeum desulfuricum]AUX07966.1 hypothetical protein AArcSl_0311 [Halalkaliarchaeum desulfuricum]